MDQYTRSALDEVYVKPFLVLDIQLPDRRISLSDGLPEVTFLIDGNAVTFNNYDENFGVWSDCAGWTDSVAEEAPSTSITIISNAAVNPIWADPANHGSPINVWFGVIDDATGAIFGEPELIYAGRFNVATINQSGRESEIDIDVISAWEKFFLIDSGERMNLRWQKTIYPGQTGLKHMASASDPVFWGEGQIKTVASPSAVTSALADKLRRG